MLHFAKLTGEDLSVSGYLNEIESVGLRKALC